MLVGICGDTHVPYRGKTMPVQAWRALAGADLYLHTGDVCRTSLLEELSDLGPVRCVLGNCDPPEIAGWGATPTLELGLDRVRVAMVHDSGPATDRAERMRSMFPDADVVVYGHSHLPAVERDEETGLLLVNPGSPTDRRRAPSHTVALLEIGDFLPKARLIELDR